MQIDPKNLGDKREIKSSILEVVQRKIGAKIYKSFDAIWRGSNEYDICIGKERFVVEVMMEGEKMAEDSLREKIRRMKSVGRIGNLGLEALENPLNFIFFLCPKLNGNGYQLNGNQTGFTVKYGKGLRKSSFERVQKVKNFLLEIDELGIIYNIKGVMADKEALILFPIPVAPPEIPSNIEGVSIISTYEAMRADFARFGELYINKPWMTVPKKFREMGFSHLSNILEHTHSPVNLVQDFVERVFAENALEGLWAKEGKFGKNPVFLGVEGPEIPILQNAALDKKDWIPYIQL